MAKHIDKSWVPRKHKKWELDKWGSRKAVIYGRTLVVNIFSFPGHEDYATTLPFTTMQIYYNGRLYDRKFPRHYQDSWLMRLAREFEYDVSEGLLG